MPPLVENGMAIDRPGIAPGLPLQRMISLPDIARQT